MPGPHVILLAGGRSRRFGTDKLDALVGEDTLLALTVKGIDPARPLLAVGPPRPTPRTARWVREDPPGSGPARALLAGLTALPDHARTLPVVVLPADAPGGGLALDPLLAAVADDVRHPGVVGTDRHGRVQPLHLALSPAGVAAVLASPPPPGASVRSVIDVLGLRTVSLPAESVFDIDTALDLAAWEGRDGSACRAVLALLPTAGSKRGLATGHRTAVVVAVTGPLPKATLTLARSIVACTGAVVVGADALAASPGELDRAQLRRTVLAVSRRHDSTGTAALVVLVDVDGSRPQARDLVDVAVLVQPWDASAGPSVPGARTGAGGSFDLRVVLGPPGPDR